MNTSTIELREAYRDELTAWAESADEGALHSGYELGRRALSEGLGVLEVAVMHSEAAAATVRHRQSKNEIAALLQSQTAFLTEALSPFEMAHRAFRDGNNVLRRINELLEAQAKRIAYALHSEAGQLLASVHFALAEAERGMPAENASHLGAVRALLGEIEIRLRNLSHELRPTVLEDLGLTAALELLADGVSKRWGLQVGVQVTMTGELPIAIENSVYRIIQEGLINTAKHASASHAEIEVRQTDHKVVFSVRDDGVGFDDTMKFRIRRPGLGLAEIRERVAALGGVLHLGLHGDGGTDMTIEIPLDA